MTYHILRLKCIFLFILLPILLTAQDRRTSMLMDILEEKWHPPSMTDERNAGKNLPGWRQNSEFRFTENMDPERSEGEPFIAVNPLDSNQIVISYMDLGFELDFPVFYSDDGGENWSKSAFSAIDTFKADFPDLFVGGGGDPVFAFDSGGRLYFGWIYLGIRSSVGTIVTYWAWSDDLGATFSFAPGDDRFIELGKVNLLNANILNEGNGVFDRPWFAVDRSGGLFEGTLYCTGLFLPSDSSQIEGEGLVLRIKKPGVDTFERKQIQVSMGLESQYSNVAVDPAGRIHVTFVDPDTARIMHALLAPGGEEVLSLDTVSRVTGFTEQRVHARENPAPSLALHPTGFGSYLAWSDYSSEMVSGYFSRSMDFGNAWSEKIRVNNLFEPSFDQVLMPVLAINGEGHLVMTWYGLDTLDKGYYYISSSLDAGDTWSPPVQVSGSSTDFSLYQPTQFFGDYYKTVFVNQTAYIAWSDGRDSLGAKMYVSKVNTLDPSVSVLPVNRLQDKIKVSHVFPSPAGSQAFVRIRSEEPLRGAMRIYTLDGKMVAEKPVEVFPHEETYSLPVIRDRGVFLLEVDLGGIQIMRRFIRG